MRLTRIVFLSLIAAITCLFAVYWTGATVYAQDNQAAPAPAPQATAPPVQAPARAKPSAATKHPKPQPRQEEAQPRQEERQPPAQAQPNNAAAQPQPNNAAAPPQPNNAAAQAPSATVFEDQVRESKIVTCANVFNVLGRGVAVDSTYTARTQWDSKASDAHSVQSLVALSVGSTNPAQRGAGVVFAAPVGHSCEGMLVRVTPTNDNCQTVAAMLAKLNGQSSAVGDLPLIALPNGAQIMLVPFGNACVAVTTLRAQADKPAQP